LSVTELIRERLASLAPESIEIEDDSAQHAGHADILRETLDGQKTMG